MAEIKTKKLIIRDDIEDIIDIEIQQLEMLNYMLESVGIDDDGNGTASYDIIDKARIREKIFDIINRW